MDFCETASSNTGKILLKQKFFNGVQPQVIDFEVNKTEVRQDRQTDRQLNTDLLENPYPSGGTSSTM